jgi:hypothetical protein
MVVETTAQLADALLAALEALAAEHFERDEREGIVRLVDTLMNRLEAFAPELREGVAPMAIAALCPRCYARRKKKALAMRRWRAKRRPKQPAE